MADPERYATVQQCRDEGLVEGGDGPSDDNVKVWLDRASELVEQATRNFFYEVSGTVIFDGNNGHILHLPYPIREVTSLTVNGDDAPLDAGAYRAYIGNSPLADYRKNPKIELRQGTYGSIYSGSAGLPLKFLKGLDQTIVGKFGYLDPPLPGGMDDRVPPIVNEVVMAIVMTIAVNLYSRFGYKGVGTEGGLLIGTLKRERTDDHEVEFHKVDDTTMLEGSLFVPYIENRLRMFKAPMGAKVTTVRWFQGGVQ